MKQNVFHRSHILI